MIYYKHDAESELGAGSILLEISEHDDRVIRQVEIYGDQYYWSDQNGSSDSRFMLADQSASVIGLSEQFLISESEFLEAWGKAKSNAN